MQMIVGAIKLKFTMVFTSDWISFYEYNALSLYLKN